MRKLKSESRSKPDPIVSCQIVVQKYRFSNIQEFQFATNVLFGRLYRKLRSGFDASAVFGYFGNFKSMNNLNLKRHTYLVFKESNTRVTLDPNNY